MPGVISADRLKRLIHKFIEDNGDKYIDGYDLIDFLEKKLE